MEGGRTGERLCQSSYRTENWGAQQGAHWMKWVGVMPVPKASTGLGGCLPAGGQYLGVTGVAEGPNQRSRFSAPGKRREGSQGGILCCFVPAFRVRHCTTCGNIALARALSFNVHKVHTKIFTRPRGVTPCHTSPPITGLSVFQRIYSSLCLYTSCFFLTQQP